VKPRIAMRYPGTVFVACALLIAASCSPAETPASTERAADPSPNTSAEPAAPAARDATGAPRIVILGDSLTAGLGVDKADSFPSLLQKRLEAEGHRYEVVNAGVSGDTTAGGLRRLDWSIDGNTRILVVALGGNDGLRGLPPTQTRANLEAIITRARVRGITVVLAGMEAPPNYGQAYTAEFRQVYRQLAEKHGVVFIPFLLQGVAGEPRLNQRDGIHPNPEGARMVERLVWDAIRPIVEGSATR
jgi:acyl-CoA thioesterase I